MTIDQIKLTPTGIALVGTDESCVELCGKDTWQLLMWLNWHIIEVGQRREMEEESPSSASQHDGKLDEEGKAEVSRSITPYVHISDRDEVIVLEAKQALSLLAWLRQEERRLKELETQGLPPPELTPES